MDTPLPVSTQEPAYSIQKPAYKVTGMALPTRVALGVFLAVAAVFLLTEHWNHVWPFLPFLLLLACPAMHLFHHHGSGGHDMNTNVSADPVQTTEPDAQGGQH